MRLFCYTVGMKANDTLREAVKLNWTRFTDQAIADKHDGVSASQVRGIRRVLGLKRDKSMLHAMYTAHRAGKVYIAREPTKQIRDAANGKERKTIVV